MLVGPASSVRSLPALDLLPTTLGCSLQLVLTATQNSLNFSQFNPNRPPNLPQVTSPCESQHASCIFTVGRRRVSSPTLASLPETHLGPNIHASPLACRTVAHSGHLTANPTLQPTPALPESPGVTQSIQSPPVLVSSVGETSPNHCSTADTYPIQLTAQLSIRVMQALLHSTALAHPKLRVPDRLTDDPCTAATQALVIFSTSS